MKRRSWVFVGVCVLIGVLANILVAWWFTATDDSQRTYGGINGPPRPHHLQWWRDHAPAGFPAEPIQVTSKPMLGVATQTIWAADTAADSAFTHVAEVRRAGWPLKSLEGTSWRSGASAGSQRVDSGVWRALSERPWLPLHPIWPGFLVNSLLFSLVVIIPIATFILARRHRRSRRHQCLHCGYPIGTSAMCTECGHPVPSHIAPSR